MARTAPVPNIPAIPGMNPGIFVLGGGGDGGGSGAGKGGAGKGKYGANGKNGGKNASGDGRDGCGTGAGSGGGCPYPHGSKTSSGVQRGDPVDVASGLVVTENIADAWLPGPLPLLFGRRYRSDLDEKDVGLGWGWTHSFSFSLYARRRTVVLTTDSGSEMLFDMPAQGDFALGPSTWILVRNQDTWVLDTNDGLTRVFSPALEPNLHRLSEVRDRHGNKLRLAYDDRGLLAEITDSVGRSLRIESNSSGRIQALWIKNAASQGRWIQLARYDYDDAGDLVIATDAEGCRTRFAYEEHRMTKLVHPNGVEVFYTYDRQGRCTETWAVLPEGAESYLASTVGPFLADGSTRARGIHHCVLTYSDDGFVEVLDSVKIQRFGVDADGQIGTIADGAAVYTRKYDANGMIAELTDGNGGTWSFERDGRGNETSIRNPLGATTTIERDPNGDIRTVVGPMGETTKVTPRPDGLSWIDPIGAEFHIRTDSRGLVTDTIAPNGAATRFEHDALGSLTRRVDPMGQIWTLEHDYLGRCTQVTSPAGATLRYEYDARGKCTALRRGGTVHRFEYDSMGALSASIDELGRATRYVRRGVGKLCEIVYPDGEVRLRYDREGRLLEVHNELGERHFFELDTQGYLASETFFDGRKVSYKFDPGGRLVAFTDSDGESMEMQYDDAGRLLARSYSSGLEETFEYDGSGRMVACTSGETRLDLDRNAVGWVTKETVTAPGSSSHVSVTYDLMGNVVSRSSSLGHEARYRRNARGWAENVKLDDIEMGFQHDVVGRPIRWTLPGGGLVETAFDHNDRMLQRTVKGPSAGPEVPSMEPAWVGERMPGVVLLERRQYNDAGELSTLWNNLHGSTSLEYDVRGQIAASIPAHGQRVVFGYDAAGNLREGETFGPKRKYGSGNKLLSKDASTYHYDACGRLIERRTASPEGDRMLSLSWSACGRLSAAETEDGTRVLFEYDPFARRTRKEVQKRGNGGQVETTIHRYVWSGSNLLHTVIEKDGRPVERRTHAFDEWAAGPWAEKIAKGDDVMTSGSWQFYLTDDLGTPEHVLGAGGELLASLDRAPFGAGDGRLTDFGFLGQMNDAETGLSYNRYRYYDPETGRYVSPDPLGIYPDLNVYRYANNDPFNACDPEGLTMTSTITGSSVTAKNRPGGKRGGDIVTNSGAAPPREDPAITQAVNNATAGRTDLPANRGCAEVNALHEMAARIREDARSRGQGELSNEQVRERLRNEFRNGATINTTDENGNQVNPCPRCSQIFRELGIHPDNINRPGETPSRGGVLGPPNPNRRRGDNPPPFEGAWDGAHVHVKGSPSRRGANTNPSNTPPFKGW